MSKKWLALVAMTALIGGVASVGCSSDDADNNDKGGNDTDAGAGGEGGEGGSGGEGGEGGTGGTGGQGGQGGNGQSCGSLEISNDETCNSCMEDMCCDELADCDEGTECDEFLGCVDACPSTEDQACITACAQEFPDGYAAQNALASCYQTECRDDACAAEGGICESTLGYPGNATCDGCLTDNCCDVFDPCYEDQACVACLTGSGVDCAENELFQAFRSCQIDSCNVACPMPNPICDSPFSWGDSSDEKAAACAECQGENCCEAFNDCGENALCSDCITGEKTGAVCDPVKTLVDAVMACSATGGPCATACK